METTNLIKTTQSLTILYWRHQTRSQKLRDRFTVYARLTYNGQRADFSTGVSGKMCEFENEGQRFINSESNASRNQVLDAIENELLSGFANLRLGKGLDFNVRDIVKVFRKEPLTKPIPTFSGLLEEFWELRKVAHITGEISPKTLKKESGWKKKVVAFVAARYGKSAEISQIVPADSKYFVAYLKSHWKLSHNVAIKITDYLKRIMNFAHECMYVPRNPLMGFRAKQEQKRGEFLTEAELQLMERTPIIHDIAATQRDCFLFSCYTGLAWADVRELKPHQIHKTTKGYYYIFKDRVKTQQPTVIPLNNKALALLNKYSSNKYCLDNSLMMPLLPNQKVNIYLKEIANLIGIKKHLTYHVARRTAAHLALNKGIDTKALTSFMGHASMALTERHYARLEPETIMSKFIATYGENEYKPLDSIAV